MTEPTRVSVVHPFTFLSIAVVIAISLFGSATMATGSTRNYGDSTEVRRIADKLQCPVCHGQSVAESNSQVAQGMKQSIADQLAEGRTEIEIIAFFEARYGPGVLRSPPRTGIYGLVWWTPVLGILVGSVIVFSLLRQRRRASFDAQLTNAPVDPELELYRQRLRQDLEIGE